MPICIYHFLNLKFCAKIANLPKEKGYFCAKSVEMLKIGVLGTRNFGEEKIVGLNKVESVQLVGFFPLDDHNRKEKPLPDTSLFIFSSFDNFCESVDTIYIPEPETEHFDVLIQLLKKSKHLFFEQAITFSAKQSFRLIETASEAGVHIQFGHLFQYNPAFVEAKKRINQPELIVSQSLVTPQGQHSKEVVNQFIDDMVVALLTVPSEIKKVQATGVNVIGKTPDVIHAKIEFINGTVLNLTGSRISTVQHHQTEFFEKDNYIKVDFTRQKAIRLISNLEHPEITAQFEEITAKPTNTIGSAMKNFYNTIVHNKEPKVSVYTSFKAIQLAEQILDKATGSGNFDE
ncbi:MAG: hypothetical protein DRJ09_00015 [Bacteroidetes bacterium]|nr:MAG: hypothetical protein DRJ09_00015 [Bacteroidota bacterium]